MSKRINQFIQRYNNMASKSGIANKNTFSDIRADYEKKDYKLPNRENNFFLYRIYYCQVMIQILKNI